MFVMTREIEGSCGEIKGGEARVQQPQQQLSSPG